ncbi:MAG: hypothetical protein F4X82_01770 [Candidatus Spechtbacteria bacterium SB0662_bin_43]|uniref:Uncharacterized protein n=1 Tax=Candidatus Spechtbacteria bacterium SB0662_bin_43 TaxID=2604897 RepID=A0A845D927_9BACT|nr:hypothetical protein [Candidatus Spechtbacteria bacterium SB0662_bin_43]
MQDNPDVTLAVKKFDNTLLAVTKLATEHEGKDWIDPDTNIPTPDFVKMDRLLNKAIKEHQEVISLLNGEVD